MCISYLGQKVTTWVSRDHGDHLGQTKISTSYYLRQSYYMGRNRFMEHQKAYSWSPRIPSVTNTTSLSRRTPDFLKSSSHMFPHCEILKVLRTKI